MSPKEAYRLWMEGQSLPSVQARRRARRAQVPDALAERARLVAGWKASPWPRVGPPVWPIYHQPGFRRLLTPDVRRMLDKQQAVRKAQHRDEMAAAERRWRQAKALRKAPPLPLFGAVA